ncbi:MAG: Veg family protein [Actinobacteria bacterium]|nr:Veg family protein [Actinomycetota bacterium]MBU1942200.1 Veg family protein [Actinomycetota bacterium]MBU2688035.1 Veg family protein [Actinomycetota bacterium]
MNVMKRIREDLSERIGAKVKVRANKGRKVVIENMAVLEETYPHLFVVRIETKASPSQRVSYSYADIITKTVELSHPETDEALFPWLSC